jgi:hypothetical protein
MCRMLPLHVRCCSWFGLRRYCWVTTGVWGGNKRASDALCAGGGVGAWTKCGRGGGAWTKCGRGGVGAWTKCGRGGGAWTKCGRGGVGAWTKCMSHVEGLCFCSRCSHVEGSLWLAALLPPFPSFVLQPYDSCAWCTAMGVSVPSTPYSPPPPPLSLSTGLLLV